MADREAQALRDRVWSCVPVTGQAFATLLSLLDVEPSRDVPTACVTTGARSRLLVNPDFVAAHCRTDAHLAMLVLHELYHVLLGHTRLYPRVTPAQNWAFDCLINAQLCRLFPQPRYTTFFSQFAPRDGSVADLLAPPDGWTPGLAEPARQAARRRAIDANPCLGEAHWRLYDDDGLTTEALFRLLARHAADADGEAARCTLLGDHAAPDGDTRPLHPEALREVREILARWPIVERRSGRDQGGALHEDRVPPGPGRARAVHVLRRAIALAAGDGVAGPAHRIARRSIDALSPFDRSGDRRTAVQRAIGFEPLLHATTLEQRGPAPADRVRVYVDVSGSMACVLPCVYAALAGVLDVVEPTLYGFSTRIAPIGHAQLRRGLRSSTDGTEIEAVTAHLLRGTCTRALIVTDGWVGAVPETHRRRLRARGARVVVALTADGDPGFAEQAGMPVLRLPPLD